MTPTFIAVFLLGWFAWTIGEYVMHRFAMHAVRGRGIASREHLNHHADRDSILEKWPLAWGGVLLVGFLLGRSVHPALGVGWVFGYGFYDLHHWLAHKRPPSSSYRRWVDRHHFHHHFGHPNDNFGVTWPLWDIAFGTYVRPEVIRVPRRLAMIWLLDREGQVRPEFAKDYMVVGRSELSPELAARDRVDAFANRPPQPV